MRASLALASGTLLLLTAIFVALLTSPLRQYFSPASSVPEQMVFRLPMPDIVRSRTVRPPPPPAPGPQLKSLSPLPPLHESVITSVHSGDIIQDYLRSQQHDVAEKLRAKVIGSDLARELQKPVIETPALRDNQSFRSVGGDKVVRSGDSCAQIHTVQGSPSPTNKIDLAEPMSACPGASEQDMDKALHDWAEKHRPPPP
jgi:hypothetical protein